MEGRIKPVEIVVLAVGAAFRYLKFRFKKRKLNHYGSLADGTLASLSALHPPQQIYMEGGGGTFKKERKKVKEEEGRKKVS
ncbi:hypothetical protein [Thiolapillus sp.]|uniref:hypothetical protein n=1 Tax=Thiolapillus sp. TaxID=2017437 RepID=UPI003AF70AB9